MKIAICQLEIIWEDKNENIKKVMRYVAEASQKDACIIFFPEMSLTGFSMNIEKTKEENYDTVNHIKHMALKWHIAIGIGWVKACNDKAENHYTVVDKNGEVISDYIKIHPFSYSGEHLCFIGGHDICVFEINKIRMSTLICYDLRFPETFLEIPETVSCVVIPANWPEKRNKHWKCLLQARAIENQVYIIGVNCVGNQQNVGYSGDSCFINPNGEVLSSLSSVEGNVIFEIKDDIEQYRQAFPVRNDRK